MTTDTSPASNVLVPREIRTFCDPIYGSEWFAIDSDTYDCDCDQDGFFNTDPMGHGKTPDEAIADLLEQIADRDQPNAQITMEIAR